MAERRKAEQTAFCSHLDTPAVSGSNLTDPFSYLLNVLLARVYAGVPVLTDTMFLDTAALRAPGRAGDQARELLAELVRRDGLVCLRRPARSFHQALGKMVCSRVHFSSLTGDENRRLGTICEAHLSDADQAADGFLAALRWRERESYEAHLKWLDDHVSGHVEAWPCVGARSLAGRVLEDIEALRGVSNRCNASRHVQRLHKALCEGEATTRSHMLKLLDVRAMTSKAIGALTVGQRECLRLVNYQYISAFPDARGELSLHTKRWSATPGNRKSMIENELFETVAGAQKELGRIALGPRLAVPLFEAFLDFAQREPPLAQQLQKRSGHAKVFADFHQKLRQVGEDALRPVMAAQRKLFWSRLRRRGPAFCVMSLPGQGQLAGTVVVPSGGSASASTQVMIGAAVGAALTWLGPPAWSLVNLLWADHQVRRSLREAFPKRLKARSRALRRGVDPHC